MFSSEFIFFLNWLTVVPVSVCMRRSSAGELVPLDLEIEATFRRNNAERKRKLLHDRTVASILEEAHFSESSSSNSPTSRESQTAEFEAEVMAEEQPRRVTLEDYSSTSVPQYFSSVARPEVQAQNLTYPPSLIQLI